MKNALVVRKHFDNVTFKWLTEEQYRDIIKSQRLSSSEITRRFRTIVMAKSKSTT